MAAGARASEPSRKVIGRSVVRPRQQVEETIKAAILSGELKSGEMLPSEAELARQFNVSRGTLREALRVLASQHLIYKVPGARGGTFVQSVDYSALGDVVTDSVDNLLALGSIRFDEVTHMRELLEVPSVRLAAEHRSADDLAKLHEIVDRQKAASVDDPSIPSSTGSSTRSSPARHRTACWPRSWPRSTTPASPSTTSTSRRRSAGRP